MRGRVLRGRAWRGLGCLVDGAQDALVVHRRRKLPPRAPVSESLPHTGACAALPQQHLPLCARYLGAAAAAAETAAEEERQGGGGKAKRWRWGIGWGGKREG